MTRDLTLRATLHFARTFFFYCSATKTPLMEFRKSEFQTRAALGMHRDCEYYLPAKHYAYSITCVIRCLMYQIFYLVAKMSLSSADYGQSPRTTIRPNLSYSCITVLLLIRYNIDSTVMGDRGHYQALSESVFRTWPSYFRFFVCTSQTQKCFMHRTKQKGSAAA